MVKAKIIIAIYCNFNIFKNKKLTVDNKVNKQSIAYLTMSRARSRVGIF